ncbi:MAG: hypothetical protein LBU21_00200, partial [Treponema sp.]|nr:hypothetical protein [Treponema sp.]
ASALTLDTNDIFVTGTKVGTDVVSNGKRPTVKTSVPDTLSAGEVVVVTNVSSAEITKLNALTGGTVVVTGTVTLGAGQTLASSGPVKISGEVAVTGDGTAITPSATLDLSAATLSIGAGVTGTTLSPTAATTVKAIDAKSSLSLSGSSTVTVTGAFTVADAITVTVGTNATFVLDAAASGTNNGTVTINGTIQSYAHIDGDGENTVSATGKVAFGVDNGGNPVYIAGPAGDSPEKFVLGSGGTFTYGNGFYTIKGPVSVNGGWDTGLIDLHNEKLHIASGTLTIPSGKSLRMKNEGTLRSLTGEVGAQITVDNGGKLYLEENDAMGKNFYASAGTAVTYDTSISGLNIVPANTYTWTATAGGASTPGWLKNP